MYFEINTYRTWHHVPAIYVCADDMLRAVLIEQLFYQFFLSFFPRKTGKAEKTANISKVWKFNNLTEGIIFGRLRIPIFGGENGKYGNTKNCAKKILR